VSVRFLLGFLIGALIGASVALAVAPNSGADTRSELLQRVRPSAGGS
jgi:gas vesicle protein